MPCLGNTPHRQGRPPIATIVQTPKSYFCASSSKKWQTSGYHRTGPHRTLVLQYRFLFRLSYKNDGFRQIHAGGNGRSFLSLEVVFVVYTEDCINNISIAQLCNKRNLNLYKRMSLLWFGWAHFNYQGVKRSRGVRPRP